MVRLIIPTEKNKGLLIFKHLEQDILLTLRRNNLINKIRKRYFIALYFGGCTYLKVTCKEIDFIISRPNVIRNPDAINSPIINFSGSTFIPDKILKFKTGNKSNDIIGIFNRSKHKRPEDFINIARYIHSQNPSLKIRLITYGDRNNNLAFRNHNYVHKNFYHKDIITDKKLFPLSEEEIYAEISRSKYFILTSKLEGSSRIVFEALLLGLHTFVRDDLDGGTVSIDLENSGLLHIFKNEKDVFTKITTLKDSFTTDVIVSNYIESKNFAKFKTQLSVLLPNLSKTYINFQGNSFSKILPSHCNFIDENLTSSKDDMFIYSRKLLKYLTDIDQELDLNISLNLILKDFRTLITENLRRLKKRIFD
jgi:hypothetical protein